MIPEEAVMEHAGLVHRFAKRYYWRIGKAALLELDDLIQYGFIGLIKGIRNFDPELGFQPSTYLGAKIEGEIRRAIRDRLCTVKAHRDASAQERNKCRFVDSLNRPAVDGEENTELLNIIGFSPDLSGVELTTDMEQVLNRRELEVVQMRVNGLSQGDIAKRFGVTQVSVSRWLIRIKDRLQEDIGYVG